MEILQDDRIRDHLNPVSRYSESPAPEAPLQNDDDQQCEDEEEMFEMMAMQEECRLEMMKFYIQSQNPNLFENIYHDMSYPDAIKKEPSSTNGDAQAGKDQQPQTTAQTTATDSADKQSNTSNSSPTSSSTSSSSLSTSLKDLIINNLNPDAYEFVPAKFASLNLKD